MPPLSGSAFATAPSVPNDEVPPYLLRAKPKA